MPDKDLLSCVLYQLFDAFHSIEDLFLNFCMRNDLHGLVQNNACEPSADGDVLACCVSKPVS
jgi:hypothetical protein